MKTWPCVTTANDHLSIIGAKASRLPRAQAWHQLDQSLENSKLDSAQCIDVYSSHTDMWQQGGMLSGLHLTYHAWCLLKGFKWKVLWENPAKKSPRTRTKHLISECKLEGSLCFLSPLLLMSLSLCLSLRMWLLVCDLY